MVMVAVGGFLEEEVGVLQRFCPHLPSRRRLSIGFFVLAGHQRIDNTRQRGADERCDPEEP